MTDYLNRIRIENAVIPERCYRESIMFDVITDMQRLSSMLRSLSVDDSKANQRWRDVLVRGIKR